MLERLSTSLHILLSKSSRIMRNIHLQIAPAKSVSPPPLATSILLRKITFLLQITRGRSFRKKGEGKKKTSDAGFHRRQRGGVPLRAAFGISLNFAECNSLAAGQRGVLRVYVRYWSLRASTSLFTGHEIFPRLPWICPRLVPATKPRRMPRI